MGRKKVVINACFGGFSLSPSGLKRWAELKGRPCFFFRYGRRVDGSVDLHEYEPISLAEAEKQSLFFSAFDTATPPRAPAAWHQLPIEERKKYNEEWSARAIYASDIARDDADLVRMVEEMGSAADGACAELKIVEIPDDVEYVIEEYDGNEHIAEVHRTWR